jgi:tetratricopeptide (TPR) repeat protein
LLSSLAPLYYHQGRYADAELLYKRSLVILEQALGPDHPEVAISLNSLALFYLRHQGRYADALPVVRRTISNKTAAVRAAIRPERVGSFLSKASPDIREPPGWTTGICCRRRPPRSRKG